MDLILALFALVTAFGALALHRRVELGGAKPQ